LSISAEISKISEWITRHEVWLFRLLVLIHLVPILTVESFVTTDGPSHLYNSSILLELLSDSSNSLHDFYEINKVPNPNWTGHLLLTFLMTFLPALVAEKVLLVLYMVLLPISFRYLMKAAGSNNLTASYFIFPFCYSFLLIYGFFNFQIGLVVLFFSIGYYLNSERHSLKPKRMLMLVLLSLGLFFSHLFVFALFIAIVGFLNLSLLMRNAREYDWRRTFKLALVLFPTLALTLVYVFTNPIADGVSVYLGFGGCWDLIEDMQPAKAMLYGKEAVFVQWLFWLLVGILCSLAFLRLRNVKAPASYSATNWLLITLLMLAALFSLPDSSTESVGFVSSRFALFALLFCFVFISTQSLPRWLNAISVVILSYVSVALLIIYVNTSQTFDILAKEVHLAAEKIDEHSVVLTINDHDHWVYAHVTNYAGIEKPLILLENYEAAMNHFPIKWNDKNEPLQRSLEVQFNPEADKRGWEGIDYVLHVHRQSTSPDLPAEFELSYKGDYVSLFSRISR
jgi:hypothetical protein